MEDVVSFQKWWCTAEWIFPSRLERCLTHTFVSLQHNFSNMVVSSRHVVKHLRQIETLHSSPKTLRTRNNNKQKAHKKLLYTPASKLQRKKNIPQKNIPKPASVFVIQKKSGLLSWSEFSPPNRAALKKTAGPWHGRNKLSPFLEKSRYLVVVVGSLFALVHEAEEGKGMMIKVYDSPMIGKHAGLADGNCLFMTLPVCWNNFSATFLTFPKEMCEIVESKLLGLFFKKASYISSHIHGLTKPMSPKWHDCKVYKTTEKTHCFFELQKESKRKITPFFNTFRSALGRWKIMGDASAL